MLYHHGQKYLTEQLMQRRVFLLYVYETFTPWQPAFLFGSMKIYSFMGLGTCSRGYSS